MSFGVGEGWMVVCATTAEASEGLGESGGAGANLGISSAAGRRWDGAVRTITRRQSNAASIRCFCPVASRWLVYGEYVCRWRTFLQRERDW